MDIFSLEKVLNEVGLTEWCVVKADSLLAEIFPWVKSILVYYIPFIGLSKRNVFSKMIEACRKSSEIGFYVVSKLQSLGVFAQYIPPFTNLPLEKYAEEGGLGVVGRNGRLVTPRYGPRVVVAGVALDKVFEKKQALGDFNPCENCLACTAFCPVGAIGLSSVKTYKCVFCLSCVLVCPIGIKYNEEFI
ncbi:MAG: hypothetical protein DRN04_04050 [Thermoprotei archaeon]|nr:MAG: hypothetical protein DRN04_04050 [Thermoprotei archaeon]